MFGSGFRKDNQILPGLVISVALLAVASLCASDVLPQEPEATAPPASPPPPAASDAGETWHIRSPYPSFTRTRLLLDSIGLEILTAYESRGDSKGLRRLSDRPGAQISRLYTRKLDTGVVRSVELVAAGHPSGGYELYLFGLQVQDKQEGPNPDLPAIQEAIGRLVERMGKETPSTDVPAIDRRTLAYETYQLSYIEADRAMAMLKALDYTTIEFNESSGETVYDRIFTPNAPQEIRLPVVIKMISASKTSLQESTADSGSYAFHSSEVMPDLGGAFLHRTTAAEPQNRLLIAYDPHDLPSLQRVMNLLRDQVDLPARQIMLEALVIEIQADDASDLGVSFGASGIANSGRYVDTYDLSVQQQQSLATPPFTFMFNRRSDTFNFRVTLHALLESNKAKLLSNPSVLVLDGRQAKIQIGNRIPVVETTVTNTAATESVLYFPVGIVLNLRPRLSEDASEISMQVETIVSSARTSTVSPGTSIKAPEVESRQVQTFVRVANDTPFIIGGLTTNEEIKTVRGVPFFSKIPGLGALFRRKITQNIRKEIIIVVTPHIIPEDGKIFSYVIPQESPIFDSFGHELFYNAYRVRQQDVFDLDFLLESDAYKSLVACARRYAESSAGLEETDPALATLLGGKMPGEEILVRRMLWEIVRKSDYSSFIDLERLIFFEDTPDSADGSGFKLAFLSKKLAGFDAQKNALVLTYNARAGGTPDRPFTRPTATVSSEPMTSEIFADRLAAANRRTPTGEPDKWTILFTEAYSGTARPLDVLRGIIVLKSILNLNRSLDLSIRDFHPGRQIVFPTEAELRQGYALIDAEAAELFYEITSYYPAFEEEFKHSARRLVPLMGGCEWWDQGGGGIGPINPGDRIPTTSEAVPDPNSGEARPDPPAETRSGG